MEGGPTHEQRVAILASCNWCELRLAHLRSLRTLIPAEREEMQRLEKTLALGQKLLEDPA